MSLTLNDEQNIKCVWLYKFIYLIQARQFNDGLQKTDIRETTDAW